MKALYAIALFQCTQLGLKLKQTAGKVKKYLMPPKFKKKRGPIGRYRGKPERDQLILDRSSSFKKLRRHANNDNPPMTFPGAHRHDWYHRPKAARS